MWFRKGNNYLDISRLTTRTTYGITFTPTATGIKITGTAESTYAYGESIGIDLKKGKTYTLYGNNAGNTLKLELKKGTTIIATVKTSNNKITFTPNDDVNLVTFVLEGIDKGTTYNYEISNLQIEQGSSATTYNAYVEPNIYIKNSNEIYEEFIEKIETDYNPGEELIIPEGVIMPGNLTSGNSEIQCVFMTSKSLKNITNISIEDCLVVLRGINGYLDGDGTGIQLKGASNYTINTKIRNNAIIFSFVRTTKFDTTNNTPMVVYPISFKVILQ